MTESARLPVVLLWHMHQPQYRDALTGQYVLPWTYLHAIKGPGGLPRAGQGRWPISLRRCPTSPPHDVGSGQPNLACLSGGIEVTSYFDNE